MQFSLRRLMLVVTLFGASLGIMSAALSDWTPRGLTKLVLFVLAGTTGGGALGALVGECWGCSLIALAIFAFIAFLIWVLGSAWQGITV
jgi:hypothetical protein